jgi:cytidylate kinase
MMRDKLVITIDGPAGAGKSTVSKMLARHLACAYLDTGALYRAIAYEVLREGRSPDDEKDLADLCGRTDIHLVTAGRQFRIIVNGQDVTEKIRTEQIGLLASKISALPVVRSALFALQKKAGNQGGVVAEGRDMGTVVFPEADYKFFLVASSMERAKRRYKELRNRGEPADFESIRKDIVSRDNQDRGRDIAPLVAALDAVVIDSTSMTIVDVVDKMLSIIQKTSA